MVFVESSSMWVEMVKLTAPDLALARANRKRLGSVKSNAGALEENARLIIVG